MADNWQAGDVALCVDDRIEAPGYYFSGSFPIKAGECYTVMDVFMSDRYSVSRYGKGGLSLRLLEEINPHNPVNGYAAERFQKQPTLVVSDTVEIGEKV